METENNLPEAAPAILALALNRFNLDIAQLATSEPSRYTLAAVNLTREFTEVTDGHRAIRVTLPRVEAEQCPLIDGFALSHRTEPFESFRIGKDLALKIAKAIPKEKTLTILNHAQVEIGENGTARLAVTDLDAPQVFTSPKPQDGFPDIDKVMPAEEDYTLHIHVDAKYLISILKQVEAFKKAEKYCHVKMSFIDDKRVMRLTATNSDTGQELTAVLMPVRA